MNPTPQVRATMHRWNDIPLENLSPLLDRRLVTGERVMLAHAHLKRGCVVPMHRHVHAQFAYVVQGKVKFTLGDEGGETMTLQPGEVLHLPSELPHQAEALDDTFEMDIFSPIRQDWLDGTDTYFHKT